MENASQALIIAGAILLAILIIAIGMYIYNSASATINDSLTNMSTQEIEAFNNQFESYRGKQTGSQISSLVGRLIANANTYEDESGKVPACTCAKINRAGDNAAATYTEPDKEQLTAYISELTKIKNRIENKHPYYVDFAYDNSGLVGEIIIYYDNPAEDNG